MAFLNLFGKKKETSKFEFPSQAALETPPRPPVSDIEELPEVPEPEEGIHSTLPTVEEHEIHEPAPAENLEPVETHMEVHREDVVEIAPRKPIFVKVDLYKNLMNEISSSSTTLKESESSLTRLSNVKSEEDHEFEKWHKQMNDIQRKLIFVDKTLFE